MTADVELLPLPEASERNPFIGHPCYFGSQMQDYARAVAEHNVKERDAEIEALRALLLEACDDGDEADADLLATLERARTAEANVKALRAEVRDLRRRQAGWGRHIAAAGCEYVREGEHDALVNRRAERLAEALRLIAAPKRQDGTWNRDREACRQIAENALRDHDQEGKDG